MADASNNAFIVYGRTSAGGEFASAYVTGRAAADPVNTLRVPALLQAGTSALTVTNPAAYGQYFGAALDPDDGTVWVVGEYVASATGVGRVGGEPLGAAAADGHQAGQRHRDGDQRAGRDHLSDRLHRVLRRRHRRDADRDPGAGSFFTGWGGACGGLGATCDVLMDRPAERQRGLCPAVRRQVQRGGVFDDRADVGHHECHDLGDAHGGMHAGVTVHFATVAEVGAGKATAGVDYEPRSQTLTFAAGQATVTATIPIMPDTLAEGAETVKLLLTGPAGGAVLGSPAEATLTIQDNDQAGAIQFVLPTYTVGEPAAVTTTGPDRGHADRRRRQRRHRRVPYQ